MFECGSLLMLAFPNSVFASLLDREGARTLQSDSQSLVTPIFIARSLLLLVERDMAIILEITSLSRVPPPLAQDCLLETHDLGGLLCSRYGQKTLPDAISFSPRKRR